MFGLLSQVLFVACVVHAAEIDFKDLFESRVSNETVIASANDGNFSSVLSERWSLWKAPVFEGAIKPATESDVQEIVKTANNNNISFLATVNGHGCNSHYGSNPIDLNINLRGLNHVSIDAAANRMTVGGGVTFGEVFPLLHDAGKEMPTGNAVCVGLVGVTVGGGVGTQLGLHGLSLDALISARIVVGNGDIVTASRTENPDLFWALRGAGANFGIITSATYEIYDQTNDGLVLYNTYTFAPEANRSVFELMQYYDDKLPGPMSFIPEIMYNQTTGQAKLMLLLVYYGTQAEAQPHIDKILALGPLASTSYYGSHPGMFEILSIGLCTTAYRNHFHVGTKQTDPKTYEDVFADMVSFYETHPGYRGVLIFQRLSTDVVLQKPAADAVYPWREITTFVLMLNSFDSDVPDADLEAIGNTVRSKIQATSGFDTPNIYINYDYGDESLADIYGADNLKRLSQVKARWDPGEIFGKGNPIPLRLDGHDGADFRSGWSATASYPFQQEL